jgi:hypothetical protein
MPVSRKRSCAGCRGAKARCNLAVPRCSRCVDRGLLCEYADGGGGFRGVGAVPYSRPSVRREETLEKQDEAVTSASTSFAIENLFGDDSLDVCQTTSPLEVATWDTDTLTGPNSVAAFSTAQNDHALRLNNIIMDGFGPFQSFADAAALTSGLLDIPGPTTVPSPVSLCNLSSPQMWTSHGSGTMRKRPSPSTAAHAPWLILVGQIESYPKMMMHGLSLPPFIHSRCSLEGEGEDGRPFTCQEKMSHQCLPEILGICAALVHLFHAKTEASGAFVWKIIYAEQARL